MGHPTEAPSTIRGMLRNGRTAAAIFCAGLFLIYGVIFYQLRNSLAEGYSDFISFYTAGKILERGAAPRLYDLRMQYEIQREIAPRVEMRQGALPFVRPAFEAWLFWPLAFLPYSTAFVVWNLVSTACAVGALLVLRWEIPGLVEIPLWLALAAGLSYFPLFFAVLQGQDSLVLLLLYALAWRALRREKWFACGLILGIGVFKFPLILPMLVAFALHRKWNAIVGFAVTCGIAAAISVATVGWAAAMEYPRYLLHIDLLAPGVNRVQDLPNLRGLLSMVPGMSGRIGLVVLAILSATTLALASWTWRFPARESIFALGFGLNVIATVLVSYHCHVFDLSLLLVPISAAAGFLLGDVTVPGKTRQVLPWTLCLMMFSPVYLWVTVSTARPSLVGLLVVGFGCVLGRVITQARDFASDVG